MGTPLYDSQNGESGEVDRSKRSSCWIFRETCKKDEEKGQQPSNSLRTSRVRVALRTGVFEKITAAGKKGEPPREVS